MKQTCKQCGTAITSESDQQTWARCPNCRAVLDLAGSETSTDLAQMGTFLAKGMTLKLIPDGLQISYKWFKSAYIGLALMALIWNGAVFWSLGTMGWWIFIVPHFWIGLGMAIWALINLLNRTTITIKPGELKIGHFPFPYPGSRRIDPILLKQLYVQEVKKQKKSSISYTYNLLATTWSGQEQKIVTRIEEAQTALALEKEMERLLQIKDQPMPGEFRWLSNEESRRLQYIWRALAEAMSLKFSPGTATEKAEVYGVYRGYYLHLNAFYNSKSRRTGTRIVLTPVSPPVKAAPPLRDKDSPGQALSPQELLALLVPDGIPYKESELIDVNAGAKKIYYEYTGSISEVQQLRRVCDRVVTLAEGYARLQALGAEALPALAALATGSDNGLNSVARQLFRDIVAETTARLGQQPAYFYCRHCLTRCAAHSLQPNPVQTFIYYGCRTCRQSRSLIEWPGPVIAVLDSQMTEQWVMQAGAMRVNWLKQRALFDFRTVEIIRADDEEVERFASQVGNDTDPLRQDTYKQITCHIATTCRLSENSLRVLRRIFGQVERRPLPADVVERVAVDEEEEREDFN